MSKYLIGICPECKAINAAAIRMDCITDADWQDTRDEFEESGLVVSDMETAERVTINGCAAECERGQARQHRPGRPEIKLTTAELDSKLRSVSAEIICGLMVDGAHHKQHHLETALLKLYGQEFVDKSKAEFEWAEGMPS